MKIIILILVMAVSLSALSQQERDTVLSKCPVSITDTVSSNNFFLEFQPATVKVYRIRGNLTITIEQRDQFFTIQFNEKRLGNKKYKIGVNTKSKNGVYARYAFKVGDQVSYAKVTSGTVDVSFDKATKLWNIKAGGLLSNYVGQTVTLFKVKADFYIR